MTLTITYRFKSLASLADHFARIAETRRQEATYPAAKKRHVAELRAEASAFEQAADVIRRCVVEG